MANMVMMDGGRNLDFLIARSWRSLCAKNIATNI